MLHHPLQEVGFGNCMSLDLKTYEEMIEIERKLEELA